MNQNQFDALVSLCYNCRGGSTLIANSPLVRFLKGELSESQARTQYSSYIVTAGGKVLQGLINRRNAEADLFFSGIKPSIDTILNVNPGFSVSETYFSWNKVTNADHYDLKIWKNKIWEGDAYYVEWGLKDTSCSLKLPAGNYEAYVDTTVGDDFQMSNVVAFFSKRRYYTIS